MSSAKTIALPSSEVLATLFDALPIGIVAMDIDTRVVVFNTHEEKLAGRRRESVLGRRFFDEIAPCMNVRELAGAFRSRVRAASLDETIEFSFPFPHVDQPRDVVVRLKSFIAGGAPHGMLLIEDVSMQRSVERLKETLAQLLVHDMKSPLTSVLANLEFVRDQTSATSNVAEALDDGILAAHRLNRMVLDLLDITRLETGTFPLTRQPTDVQIVLEEAVASATATARTRDLRLAVDTAGSVVATVDKTALRRIVDNLLDNAIRHSPREGRVTLRLRSESDHLVLDVVDQGPGVPKELREAIFEKFVQVRAPSSRSANHGLGLTFVRMASRAHGGDVQIEPGDDGRGTTFRVSLPAKEAGSTVTMPTSSSSG